MPTAYEILGVEPTASDDDIKKAYRKIAFETHPDRNPNNPESEAKFKLANDAYEKLDDPAKRQDYDLRLQGKHPQQQEQASYEAAMHMAREEVIREVFTRMSMGNGPMHGFGRPMQEHLEVHGRVILQLKDILHGKTEELDVQIVEEQFKDGVITKHHHKFKVPVKIPPGLRGGILIQTNVTLPNGIKKTLNIEVLQEADPRYDMTMQGDLYGHLWITYPQAILGGICDIELIDGKKEKIKIQKGTRPGQKIRIAEQGLPKNMRDLRRGDLYYVVEVDIPTTITQEQKEVLENLQKLFEQQNPPKSS
jgi:curved DNA-binding protein